MKIEDCIFDFELMNIQDYNRSQRLFSPQIIQEKVASNRRRHLPPEPLSTQIILPILRGKPPKAIANYQLRYIFRASQ